LDKREFQQIAIAMVSQFDNVFNECGHAQIIDLKARPRHAKNTRQPAGSCAFVDQNQDLRSRVAWDAFRQA
jgi:hypothetical protein